MYVNYNERKEGRKGGWKERREGGREEGRKGGRKKEEVPCETLRGWKQGAEVEDDIRKTI